MGLGSLEAYSGDLEAPFLASTRYGTLTIDSSANNAVDEIASDITDLIFYMCFYIFEGTIMRERPRNGFKPTLRRHT